MKIYVGHATSFDYKEQLYKPILESVLYQQHQFILPHREGAEPFNSKEIIKSSDLFLAEVSYPSTGLGIELGWAEIFGVPVFAIYQEQYKPSSAIKIVARKVVTYTEGGLQAVLEDLLGG